LAGLGAEASQPIPRPPAAGSAEAGAPPPCAAVARASAAYAVGCSEARRGRLGRLGRRGLATITAAPSGRLALRCRGVCLWEPTWRRSRAPRTRHLEALPEVEALSQVSVRAAGLSRAAPPQPVRRHGSWLLLFDRASAGKLRALRALAALRKSGARGAGTRRGAPPHPKPNWVHSDQACIKQNTNMYNNIINMFLLRSVVVELSTGPDCPVFVNWRRLGLRGACTDGGL